MNKVYSLILAVLIGAAAVAADRPRGGTLTISVNDNSAIRINVDGRNYSDRDNSFTISNIQAGYHNVQVYRLNSSRNPFDIFGRNREQLIFNNSILVKPLYQVDVVINRNGRADVREYDLSRNQRNGGWNGNGNNDRRGNDGDRDDRYDHNGRDNRNNGYDNHDPRNNNGGYDNRDNRDNRTDNYYGGLSYQQFQSMKETLRRENFENTRLGLATQMFDRNSFRADQVKELLQLFSFENYKLDLAKYAYRNTVDRNNYYLIYDVFNFSNSRQELANFISNYR